MRVRLTFRTVALGGLAILAQAEGWVAGGRMYSQMVSTGATDRPMHPLPPSRKLPMWTTVTAAERKQIDEVRSGGFHISSGDFRVHFGLGAEKKCDVTIRWVGGASETVRGVDANQWIVIREGKGIVNAHPFVQSAQARGATTSP